MTDAIDLTDRLDAIRAAYPDYYRSTEATQAAAALWGSVAHNDCGVIAPAEILRIELMGQPRWKAAISLANAPNGWWSVSTGYDYPSGGGSAPISVWANRAYATREAAIGAGIGALITTFEGVRDWRGTRPASEIILAERMIKQLAALRGETRQMSLF